MTMKRTEPDFFDRLFDAKLLKPLSPVLKKHREALLYLFFGALTTLISILSFYLFYRLCRVNELLANVLSWILAVLFAYVTNSLWVFCDGELMSAKKLASFYAGRLFTLGVEELILYVFITRMALNAMAVKIVAQIVIIVLNYVVSKVFVFKKT